MLLLKEKLDSGCFMNKLEILKERKKSLEKALFSNQYKMDCYENDREIFEEVYDCRRREFEWVQGVSDKEEQFHNDTLVATCAFTVGMLPKFIGNYGTVDVAISSLIGLAVCGSIVLLRNQPYLSRRILDFGDLEELEVSLYDTEERLKGIDSGTSFLQSKIQGIKRELAVVCKQPPVKK